MSPTNLFLRWWLRWGRYPWSRLRRGLLERGNLKKELPQASSLTEIQDRLSQVTWTMDNWTHLFDSISYPQTVWAKKKDDCDGFACLAAALLSQWDPETRPVLITTMVRPMKQSHTVCAFRQGDAFRYFDNSRLDDGTYDGYPAIANRVSQRGNSAVCWDVADPRSLRTVEYHLAGRE